MSNISDFYNKILEVIPTITGFSSKTEIPNPYQIAANSENFLENAWGVKMGDVSPGALDSICCVSTSSHLFSIVLCLKVISISGLNASLHSSVKSIYEDAELVRAYFLNCNEIGIPGKIEKIDFISVSGLQYVFGDKNNFVTLQITFRAELAKE